MGANDELRLPDTRTLQSAANVVLKSALNKRENVGEKRGWRSNGRREGKSETVLVSLPWPPPTASRTPPFPNTPRPPHTPSRKTRAYRGSSTLTHSYRTPISRARRPRNAAMTSSQCPRAFPDLAHTPHPHAHTTCAHDCDKRAHARMYHQCMASVHPPSPLPRSGSARSPKTAKSRPRDQSIAKFHLRDQRQQPACSCSRHGSGSGRAPGAVRLAPVIDFVP